MAQQRLQALVHISFALANLIVASLAAGQDEKPEDQKPVWTDPVPLRIAMPEPRIVVAAEPRKAPVLQADGSVDGADAFQNNCTTCHDADRSLKKKNSLSGWRITVGRMAAKKDADIPVPVREPIAQYLSRLDVAGSGEAEQAGSSLATGKEPAADTEKAALIEQGKAAFNTSCVTCHDAERSLSKTKSLSAWRQTVRRMADKDGANIPESTHEAIATYLASLGNNGKGDSVGEADAGSPISVAATVSAMYRGSGDPNLEDPGHFGDGWVGIAYQPKGPVSARITSCTTCHSQGLQLGNSIDLVEATVRLDLNKAFCPNHPEALPAKAHVEAGRFVVPFGAYYQQVNPGVDRAVSEPLVFNMGERVYPTSIGDPVLPMPDADEGASMDVSFPLLDNSTDLSFIAYMVNGLEGNDFGINFYQSRDYSDNNRWPAVGGRVAAGNSTLRVGGSVMGGRFNSDAGSGPNNEGLNYLIFGGDAVFRWKDVLRIQFEYAQRNSERFDFQRQPGVFSERVSGFYLESELLIVRKPQLSLFARYDRQLHESPEPVLGSLITTGDFAVDRYTVGINWTLPGGSLLMLNDEIWNLPQGPGTVNVIGTRWAVAF